MALELLERPDTIAEGKPPVDPVVRRLREWHARDLVQLAKVATLESEVQIERAQRLRIEQRALCSDMGVADLRVDVHSDVGMLDATGSPPAVSGRRQVEQGAGREREIRAKLQHRRNRSLGGKIGIDARLAKTAEPRGVEAVELGLDCKRALRIEREISTDLGASPTRARQSARNGDAIGRHGRVELQRHSLLLQVETDTLRREIARAA